MATPFRPHGAWTALATPFSADRSVDNAGLRRLTEFQIDQGIDGVLPCGTTGESPTLTWQEHDAVIDDVIKTVDGRVGVLAGTGSNNTQEAIRGTEHAKEVGADAVMLVDCYYNGPSSLELRTEYYERILDAVADIPIVPYVIPGRSGCALGAADLAILHLNDPKRLPAVKEATGDFDRMREERRLAGPSLSILSGDDDVTLKMMVDAEIRCVGVISVVANIVPGAVGAMVRSQANGDETEAAKLGKVLDPLMKLVGCTVTSTRSLPNGQSVEVTDKFRNPVPIKTMMAALGMLGSAVRPPLGKMSREGVARCRETLQQVHARDASILSPIEEAFDVRVDQRLQDDTVWASLTR